MEPPTVTAQSPSNTQSPPTQPQCFHSPGTEASHSQEHPAPVSSPRQTQEAPQGLLLGAAVMYVQNGTHSVGLLQNAVAGVET